MANCKKCDAPLEEGNKFCMSCGTPADEALVQPASAQPQPAPVQPQQETVYVQPGNKKQKKQKTQYYDPSAPGHDSKYEPITTKGYIGIALLMAIPVVGIILAIIWACGGCRKINKRNFARAMLIMMLIGLIISLIIGGIAGFAAKRAAKEAGLEDGQAAGIISSLLGGGDDEDNGDQIGDNGSSELNELAGLLSSLEALTGEESGFDDLLGSVEDINKEASKNSSGWPKDLPDYPDGTMNEVENYRTEITGTSEETMMKYIDTLKKKGYEYEDFYDFGMTEEEMLDMSGWWGTNGKWYLGLSYYDGTVTIDHTTELPDMSSLFG